MSYEYLPRLQTPKFEIIKKIKHPLNAPDILDRILLEKYLVNKPINTILPHVNAANSWNPMKISVIAKHNINAGIYLIPNKTGT